MCIRDRVSSNFVDDGESVEIELDFKERRVSQKKRMPGEKEKATDDSAQIPASQKYKIIYFEIIDCVCSNIEERFEPNKDILNDCSWLNPKKFPEILKIEEFSSGELNSIAKLSKVDRSTLLAELRQFAG